MKKNVLVYSTIFLGSYTMISFTARKIIPLYSSSHQYKYILQISIKNVHIYGYTYAHKEAKNISPNE